jgi:regulator of replication initiation timing
VEIEKIKFVIITYNTKVKYNNEIFQEVLDKETTTTWKKAINIAEKKKRKFSKKDYPQRKIVIKERYKEGWKVVSTRT